jgi:hypothetical protein
MAHYQPSSAFTMAHYRRDVRGHLPLPHACGTRRIGGRHIKALWDLPEVEKKTSCALVPSRRKYTGKKYRNY